MRIDEIAKVELLELKPGQVLVLTLGGHVPDEQKLRMRDEIGKRLPVGVQVFVLDEGAKFLVLDASPMPNSQQASN